MLASVSWSNHPFTVNSPSNLLAEAYNVKPNLNSNKNLIPSSTHKPSSVPVQVNSIVEGTLEVVSPPSMVGFDVMGWIKALSKPSIIIPGAIRNVTRISPWSLPKLSRTDRRNIKLLFLLALIGIESSSEIYVRLPQEMVYGRSPDPIPIVGRSDAESMVVIFPGAGGPDYNTDKLLRSISENDRIKGIRRFVSVYDWSAWRGDFIRAAFDGQSVGKSVCSSLVKDGLSMNHPVKNLHAIGTLPLPSSLCVLYW